ncbi:MAG: hypothetical protein J6S76_05570 [Clostridia bacterium]|nr:hypothetical protein [Clostridia bacterium]
MAKRINNGPHNESNEFGNYVEYCVEKRPEGAYRRNRILLLLACILVAVAIIPIVTYSSAGKALITFVPIWMALCGIGYWFLSRFVNIEYEYRVIQGEFQMDIVYGQRQRKEVMSCRVRDMEIVHPYDEEGKAAVAACNVVYDCSISQKKPTPDVYYLTYTEEGKKYAVIFEATKKALDVMKFYNKHNITFSETLRH